MFSLKAPKNAAAAPATSTSRLDLHPVAHIADCLLDYQKQLSTSEVHSLDELQSITQAESCQHGRYQHRRRRAGHRQPEYQYFHLAGRPEPEYGKC